MLETGDGVQKSMEEAARVYRLAADQGLAPAMFNLGVVAHEDDNPQLAKEWYEKAVAHGVTDAFLNLGMLAQKD